jgi:phenylacetate-CoA ligase
VNIYGTADAAMIGHETPVSIALRKTYNRRMAQTKQVFGTEILPSLVQYYPERRYFEAVNGELVFTARAGIPLMRYNIHDAGGVLSYQEATEPVREHFKQELAKYEIKESDWKLPFVYLNGRKDFTVTIYAVNIYPENIKAALVDPKMRSWVTGKFTMATKYHSDMDQYFEINIELARGVKPESDYQQIARQTILGTLTKLNGEFRKLSNAVGKRAEPEIHLIANGDPEYFKPGVKHKWVKRT